jgi:uncharacterized protein YbaR (Trm112 family)
MTSQTSRNTGWRRAAVCAVASGALAAGLMAGMGLANAEPVAPADPTTGADAPPPMTADQAIAIIATEYDTGAGGGQLSTLVHQVLKLRSQGFYRRRETDDIVAALDKRPNQEPLIAALHQHPGLPDQEQDARSGAAAGSGDDRDQPVRPDQPRRPGIGINPGNGPIRATVFDSHALDQHPVERPIALDQRRRDILVCPEDRGPLRLVGDVLYNPRLRRAYRIEAGVPVLLVDEAVTIDDDTEHQRLIERADI